MIEAVRAKFGPIKVSGSETALAEANGMNRNGGDESDDEIDNFKEELLCSDTNWLATGATFARARRQTIGISERWFHAVDKIIKAKLGRPRVPNRICSSSLALVCSQ